MRLQELKIKNQDALLTGLMRFVYPLYCITDVENYDYFFIGTCFSISIGKRVFIVFTDHQFNLANGKTICLAIPEFTDRFIGIDSRGIYRFSSLDLAIFELTDEQHKDGLHMINETLMKPRDKTKQMEFIALGCQRELNAVNYETKLIAVQKAALITNKAKLDVESPEFYFPANYLLASHSKNFTQLESFNQRTQGLSGSPVFAFTINEENEHNGNIDLHLVGVATHVSEKEQILYTTHPMQLLSALNVAYGIFSEFENEERRT